MYLKTIVKLILEFDIYVCIFNIVNRVNNKNKIQKLFNTINKSQFREFKVGVINFMFGVYYNIFTFVQVKYLVGFEVK